METDLINTLDKYFKTYDEIRKNRADIREISQTNRWKRNELSAIRKSLYIIMSRFPKKDIYKVCLAHYGKIDKHYHLLYNLFIKNGD